MPISRRHVRSQSEPPPSASGPLPGTPARTAISQLVASHGPRLYSVAMRMCGNASDAEDMLQDVFLQAFRKWHTFRGDAGAGSWLYAIAARSCKARLRRKGGVDRRTPAMSQLMPWRETTVMEVAAAPEGDEDPAERNEAVARVQSEIARLPEYLRVPLVLKEVLGASVDDVGGALGLDPSTVKTRLHRARLALRKAMTAKAASVPAPAPIYERQVCLDLFKAKMEALDRGGTGEELRLPPGEVCARCRAVFRELDLVQDACVQLAGGKMPRDLREKILSAIAQRDAAERGAEARPRRGRRPVEGKARRPVARRV